MGRFLGTDPENAGADAESPQSWNMYSYVQNRIVLKLVNVFPEGGGTGTPGVGSLMDGLRGALGDLKSAGFSEVQIDQTLRMGNLPRLINGWVIHL